MLTIEEFNDSYKLGCAVKYRNDKGERVDAFVRHPAEKLDSGREVFWATGSYNAISLKDLIHEHPSTNIS